MDSGKGLRRRCLELAVAVGLLCGARWLSALGRGRVQFVGQCMDSERIALYQCIVRYAARLIS